MRCPYCAEDIKDGATVCRYCDRDLSFYAPIEAVQTKTTELKDEVRKINERLDELRPINEDVLLTRLSNVERDVQSILAALDLGTTGLASRQGSSHSNKSPSKEDTKQKDRYVPSHPPNQQREDQQRTQQGDTGIQQSSGQEGRKEAQATAKASTLIKAAAGHVIDNLTTAKPEWRLIWLSVLFASLLAILGYQIALLLNVMLDRLNPPYTYLEGLKWWGYDVANFFLVCSYIVPIMFGFRASLARPGGRFSRRLITYILLGLLVGLMVFIGNLALTLLGGTLGLPANFYYSGLEQAREQLPYVMATWFTSASALFVLGALMADSVKSKKKLASRPAPS